MNIDFELYRIFYVVANNGNITKASLELNISQPAISKSIKNLEEQLGGTLFVRTKRGVILTEEGLEFYKYIKQAIEYISSAENRFSELSNLEVGTIRIGISTTLTKEFLLPYLEKFHLLYPKIDIQIITGMSSELFSKLRNGLVDIVILNLKNKEYDQDLEIIPCREIHDIFVASPTYLNTISPTISLTNLNNYPLILQAKGSNTRSFLDNFMLEQKINLKPSIELTSYSLVYEFTKLGLGIGYVTKEYISDDLKNGNLVEIELDKKIPSRFIGIVLSKTHLPSFSTKKLLEIILQNQEPK